MSHEQHHGLPQWRQSGFRLPRHRPHGDRVLLRKQWGFRKSRLGHQGRGPKASERLGVLGHQRKCVGVGLGLVCRLSVRRRDRSHGTRVGEAPASSGWPMESSRRGLSVGGSIRQRNAPQFQFLHGAPPGDLVAIGAEGPPLYPMGPSDVARSASTRSSWRFAESRSSEES